jgi:hypothetical protein
MTDYPSTRQLRAIRNWTGTFRELWAYVVALWHWPEWGVKEDSGAKSSWLELHTGGWSGNEDIIYALEHGKSNFFMFFHEKWERGGHYYFEVAHNLWDFNPSVERGEVKE